MYRRTNDRMRKIEKPTPTPTHPDRPLDSKHLRSPIPPLSMSCERHDWMEDVVGGKGPPLFVRTYLEIAVYYRTIAFIRSRGGWRENRSCVLS